MIYTPQTCGGTPLAEAVRELYRQGQTDYSLEPIVLIDNEGKPIGRIKDGDAVIFCCRRGEREVQLTEMFVDSAPAKFSRRHFQNLTFVILTLYHEKFRNLPVAFAPTKIENTLGEIISQNRLRQLHIAESEKFAHVTFFFNGNSNQPFPGEEDICIPSPKGIPFDQAPEMRSAEVAEQILLGIEKKFDLIVANFANGDVIGHTQNRNAKIKCAEIIDSHLAKIVNAGLNAGYTMLITADHGNLEEMIHANGTPNVAHTANPVPLLVIDAQMHSPITRLNSKLADIAPTVLQLLNLAKPSTMDGVSLIDKYSGNKKRVLIVILDGWGVGKQDQTNPIFLAQTPVWDDLLLRYPSTQLQAAGEAVGLQPDKSGNSEAGHMNIGAGRIVLQDDVRLDLAMKNGSFSENVVFKSKINEVKQRNACLHLIGLLSEKSSHGSIDYPLALLQIAKIQGLKNVFLHLVFDGRSTEPGSVPAMLEKLELQLQDIGVGRIVTGMGRGIALDRDGNYDRTKRAYDALVFGIGKTHIAN